MLVVPFSLVASQLWVQQLALHAPRTDQRTKLMQAERERERKRERVSQELVAVAR